MSWGLFLSVCLSVCLDDWLLARGGQEQEEEEDGERRRAGRQKTMRETSRVGRRQTARWGGKWTGAGLAKKDVEQRRREWEGMGAEAGAEEKEEGKGEGSKRGEEGEKAERRERRRGPRSPDPPWRALPPGFARRPLSLRFAEGIDAHDGMPGSASDRSLLTRVPLNLNPNIDRRSTRSIQWWMGG